ncbi:hypothetical protein D3C73_1615290 [compost metagenome]
MRQVNADLVKYVHGESGAIKAVCRYTAGYVFSSDGFVDDFIHLGICESASCSNGKDNRETQ